MGRARLWGCILLLGAIGGGAWLAREEPAPREGPADEVQRVVDVAERPTQRPQPEYSSVADAIPAAYENDTYTMKSQAFPPGEWWAMTPDWTVLVHQRDWAGSVAIATKSGEVRVYGFSVSLDLRDASMSALFSDERVATEWKLVRDQLSPGYTDHFVVQRTSGLVSTNDVPFNLYFSTFQATGGGKRGDVFARLRHRLELHPVLPRLRASSELVDQRVLEPLAGRVVDRVVSAFPRWRYLAEERFEMPADTRSVLVSTVRQAWAGAPALLDTKFRFCVSPRAAETLMRSVVLSMKAQGSRVQDLEDAFVFDEWTVVLRVGSVFWQGSGSVRVLIPLARIVASEAAAVQTGGG